MIICIKTFFQAFDTIENVTIGEDYALVCNPYAKCNCKSNYRSKRAVIYQLFKLIYFIENMGTLIMIFAGTAIYVYIHDVMIFPGKVQYALKTGLFDEEKYQ